MYNEGKIEISFATKTVLQDLIYKSRQLRFWGLIP